MKRISKTFNTLEQAERFQDGLYDQYDHVRLVQSPRWGEFGTYVWEVK